MNKILPTLTFALFACAESTKPDEPQEDIVDDTSDSAEPTEEDTNVDEELSEEDQPEDDTPSEETGSTDGEQNQSSDSSSYILETNTWYVNEATMLEDTCQWDTQLRQFFGIGSEALLPDDFTVEGFEGAFAIQANSYGASSPITCEQTGRNFDCETQSVTPLDFDLGTYGWTYAIDFSGSLNDSQSLVGTATVRFPTISEWLVPVFDSMGVDYTQCIQRFELSISAN